MLIGPRDQKPVEATLGKHRAQGGEAMMMF
jgi:hypothetical protein